MRLWSLHPQHLDGIGLVACWREALLAQAVLAGRTRGYTSHPQLARFRATADPESAIATYLHGLLAEADSRGYRFDASRVARDASDTAITVTTGQLAYEWSHLGAKLDARSPEDARRWLASTPQAHPMFVVVPGDIADWERHVEALAAPRGPR